MPESDTYQRLTNSQPGRFVARRLGLPASMPLRRYEPGQPLLAGPALVGGTGRLREPVADLLRRAGAEVRPAAGDETERYGALVQLCYVAPGAEGNAESTLRFLLSARSAYVSGQVVRVGEGDAPAPADWSRPLDGQVAVVTGGSRGIGAAIAAVLARASGARRTTRRARPGSSAWSGRSRRCSPRGPGRSTRSRRASSRRR